MPTLDEELENAEELASLKQQQRRQRLQKAARLGENFAKKSGNEEFAGLLNEGGNLAGSGGLANTDAADKYGKKFAGYAINSAKVRAAKQAAAGQSAGKFAEKAASLGAGSEAALAGAVAGALRGEGVGGVAKSAWSTFILWFAFGFLTLDIILSPTIVSLIPAAIALLYLDFHWIMSKFGSKIFGRMNLFQQIALLFANLIVAIIPLVFIVIIYSGYWAACSDASGKAAIAAHFLPFNIGTTITAIRGDFCSAADTQVPSRSGGGGTSGGYSLLADIPQAYISSYNFGVSICDFPRVKQAQLDLVNKVFANKSSAGINFVVTSALRQPNCAAPHNYAYSCHMLGEATDFVLIPPVGDPRNPSPADAARIDALVSLGRSAGFGYIQDEYRRPSDRASGAHVHMGLSSDPNCVGRQGELQAFTNPSEYYMPY